MSDIENVEQKFDSALHLYEEGYLDESIDAWRHLLRQQPNHLDARYSLGATLIEKGDVEAAVSEYQAVLRSDPSHINSRYNLALIWLSRGYLEDAISAFDHVLKINPKHVGAHLGLGSAYTTRAGRKKWNGDWAAAQLAYQQALALNPGNVDASCAMAGLGRVLCQANKLEQGIECAQKAVSLDPTNNSAFNGLLWMQWRLFWKSLGTGKIRQASMISAKLKGQCFLPQPSLRLPQR